jgi:hypothetical protein
MGKPSRSVREWRNVDREVFENEVVPENEPAILKSILKDWPAVQESLKSPIDISNYLKKFDTGRPAKAIVGAPSINGRFFYSDDLKGFNFERKLVSVSTALDNLISLSGAPNPPAIAMQAISVAEILPEFEKSNRLALVDDTVSPRMWLGNKATTAAHYDVYSNVACVVAGQRRFTLFPPDQVANLYIGPLTNTPGGSPISMVDLRQPDLSRFPRFSLALETAREAHLEPGDALYVPILWWHAVESLDSVNVLVNYWWNTAQKGPDTPFHSLLYSMLLISGLPPEQRESWRAFFDYFVFQTNENPSAHLPPDLKDVLGSLSSEETGQLRAWLVQHLKP